MRKENMTPRDRHQNMSIRDRQKIRERKKNQIGSMFREELKQRMKQVIEHMKELLKRLES